MAPGEGLGVDIQDANKIKLRGTTNDKVAYIVTSA
jgi:hypothetical protein